MPSSPLVVASAPAVRPPSLQKPFGYRERKPQIQKGTESMSSSEIPVLGDLGIIGLLHSLVFLSSWHFFQTGNHKPVQM